MESELIQPEIPKQNFLKFYFVYRIAIMFLTLFVISRFTRLGDIYQYLNTSIFTILARGFRAFIHDTSLTTMIIQIVKTACLRIDFLTHCAFNLLAYLGVRKLILRVDLRRGLRGWVFLILILMPSFNIWSSIAGKETILTLATSLLAVRIIDYFEYGRMKIDLGLLGLFYLIIVIKIQYLPAILHLLTLMFLFRKLKTNSYLDVLVVVLLVAMNVVVVYFARNIIDGVTRNLWIYFSTLSRSTRPNPFVYQYDIFRKMYYGLFLSLWGPTFGEASISFLHLFSFFESLIIFCIFLVLLKDVFYHMLINGRLQLTRVLIIGMTVLWLLFAQYLQGMFNPGAAVRYRTNLYILLLVLFYFSYIKTKDF